MPSNHKKQKKQATLLFLFYFFLSQRNKIKYKKIKQIYHHVWIKNWSWCWSTSKSISCFVLFCFVLSCRVVNAFYCRCYRRCRHQLVYGMRYALYTLSYPLLVGYIYSTTTTTTTTQFFDTLYLFFEINILPSFSH